MRHDALSILQSALRAAEAGQAVRARLPLVRGFPFPTVHRIFAISVGKAAASMAEAIHELLPRPPVRTLVITKAGHAVYAPSGWEVIEAGHPVPDAESFRAAAAVRDLLSRLDEDDLVVLAVSGGASALLAAPDGVLTLEDKQHTTDLLLRAGADIYQMNAVRKHLSFLKGGKVAALASQATIVNLLLSDVIGDPPEVIGSGLAAPDPSTFSEALAVLGKYELKQRVPTSVLRHLEAGARGEIPETPKPNDAVFRKVHTVVVGSNHLALEAAAGKAVELGYRTLIHSSTLMGETRVVAAQFTSLLQGERLPLCVLAGGETTVTVHGSGKGGRNQEFALAAALDIAGRSDVLVLSAGTDGTDGPTDAAGAIATGDTVECGRTLGLDAREYLDRNDAYPFFAALGDLIKTGPTGTNVMDIQIMLARKR